MRIFGKVLLSALILLATLIIFSIMTQVGVGVLWRALIFFGGLWLISLLFKSRKVTNSDDENQDNPNQGNPMSNKLTQAVNEVMSKFSNDPHIRLEQMRQFLREEADAASYGDDNAQKFARTLFPQASDYAGAMREDASYPVDGPGGPQQTLLRIIMPLSGNPAQMVKFRCELVSAITQKYKQLSAKGAQ